MVDLTSNVALSKTGTSEQTSTVGEPSIANAGVDGSEVLYTGNWYASLSLDAGANWSYMSPYSHFPAAGGGFCCDQTVIHDPKVGATFWILQYVLSGGQNTLRVAVAKSLSAGTWHYYDDTVYTQNPLHVNKPNRLMRAIFQVPDLREMYLRRLRTLMDDLLQAPGTPTDQLKLEGRIDELVELMDPHLDPLNQGTDDADLDFKKWGTWTYGGATTPSRGHNMRGDVDRIKTQYFPARRDFLFNRQTVTGGGEIPLSQTDIAALPPAITTE